MGFRQRKDDANNRGTSLLRGSCDFCTKRKRKCDGKAPCSTCREMGVAGTCVYSARQKTGRKKKPRLGEGDAALTAYYPNAVPGMAGMAGITMGINNPGLSPSPATGLVGHMESFFLASYLRDFNRFVPLTSEDVVTRGMLEALSPAVDVPDPFAERRPAAEHHARLAVLWGVVALGARIVGAPAAGTEHYVRLMRASLKECFDSGDKEVVQAYLLLATLESMRGHNPKARRYLNFASTMYAGIKAAETRARESEALALAGGGTSGMGVSSGGSGSGGSSDGGGGGSDEAMDIVLCMYQHKIGRDAVDFPDEVRKPGFGSGGGGGGGKVLVESDSCSGSIAKTLGPGNFFDESEDVNADGTRSDGTVCPIKQRVLDHKTRPTDALLMLMCSSGQWRTALDPRSTCPKVRASLDRAHVMIQSTQQIVMRTSLSECIASVVPVRVWAGITLCMRGQRDAGVAEVESAVELALMRPGLMTFPLWWHAMHCAAVALAHYGRADSYVKLRAAYDGVTFPATQLPELSAYHAEAICLEGSHCRALAHWLNRTQGKARHEDCGAEGAAWAAAVSGSETAPPSSSGSSSSSSAASIGRSESFGGGAFGTVGSMDVSVDPAAVPGGGGGGAAAGVGGAAGSVWDNGGVFSAAFDLYNSSGSGSGTGGDGQQAFGLYGDSGSGVSGGDVQQALVGEESGAAMAIPPFPELGRLESFGSLDMEGLDGDMVDLGALGESLGDSMDLGLVFSSAPEPQQLHLQAAEQERAVAEAVSGSVLSVPSLRMPSMASPVMEPRLLAPPTEDVKPSLLPAAMTASAATRILEMEPMPARISERPRPVAEKRPVPEAVMAGGA